MQEAREENTIRGSSTTVFLEVAVRGLPVGNSVKTNRISLDNSNLGAERLD